MKRVVFDTSTLVSAGLRYGSVPRQALKHALKTCELCASLETLIELEQVLARAKFGRYLPAALLTEFVEQVRRDVHLFSVSDAAVRSIEPHCRDPKDNQFLALALVSEADLIVSSDQDLLVLNPWRDVLILTPAEFLVQ